jgi:hypothetical protein
MWWYSQEPAQRGLYPPTLQVLASRLSLTVQTYTCRCNIFYGWAVTNYWSKALGLRSVSQLAARGSGSKNLLVCPSKGQAEGGST